MSRDVACPMCGQPAGKRCRAVSSGRGTDTHKARTVESNRVFFAARAALDSAPVGVVEQ